MYLYRLLLIWKSEIFSDSKWNLIGKESCWRLLIFVPKESGRIFIDKWFPKSTWPHSFSHVCRRLNCWLDFTSGAIIDSLWKAWFYVTRLKKYNNFRDRDVTLSLLSSCINTCTYINHKPMYLSSFPFLIVFTSGNTT